MYPLLAGEERRPPPRGLRSRGPIGEGAAETVVHHGLKGVDGAIIHDHWGMAHGMQGARALRHKGLWHKVFQANRQAWQGI